ncbi:hypothetical protein PHMEG_0009447 [Phytophthora megakarya]|uniref:Uncharacterized protein n=1 Tax=Phytophthora megakarya TaxID=4795 RepID=A0A225WGS9_9STRA|nr:hypothetical protein PHMEG_0009447 [Phytophthora megakarya]
MMKHRLESGRTAKGGVEHCERGYLKISVPTKLCFLLPKTIRMQKRCSTPYYSICPNASAGAQAVRQRQVDRINDNKPKRRGKPRSISTQVTFKQSKLTSGAQRMAVHRYPSYLTVTLDQFVVWTPNTANIKYIIEMLHKYPVQLEDAYLRPLTIQCAWEMFRPRTYMHPFVIPADLTRSMVAALKSTKTDQSTPDPLADNIKKQGIVLSLVASIDPKLWEFSRYGCLAVMVAFSCYYIKIAFIEYAHASTVFYDIRRKTRAWIEDRKWLEQDQKKWIPRWIYLAGRPKR